jgi:hypothetical protein
LTTPMTIREDSAVWALFIAIFSAPHSYYE